MPLFPCSAGSQRGVGSAGHEPLLSVPCLAYGKYWAVAPRLGFSRYVSKKMDEQVYKREGITSY